MKRYFSDVHMNKVFLACYSLLKADYSTVWNEVKISQALGQLYFYLCIVNLV